jgi:hypothetical protein
MSYRRLGQIDLGPSAPGVPLPPSLTTATVSTATTDPGAVTAAREAREAEIAEKVAARDAERERQRQVEMLKQSDRALPATEYHEDWTPVPGAQPEAAAEQKVPWLWIGIGGAALLGVGYWIWRR